MNVWSFLHYQCLRLAPRTVGLLILAGLVGFSMVICFAGQSAVTAIMVGTCGAFVKKLVGKATGGA
jgi:hypothetical protein